MPVYESREYRQVADSLPPADITDKGRAWWEQQARKSGSWKRLIDEYVVWVVMGMLKSIYRGRWRRAGDDEVLHALNEARNAVQRLRDAMWERYRGRS